MSVAPEPKILVVDDSLIVTKIVSRILGQRGYTVLCAGDGSEALQIFSEHRLSLIILDVNLPGMDGFEVANQIRLLDEKSFLPILFLSANAERHSRLRGLQHGGWVFMGKPIHEDEFLAQVESLLKIKELQDTLEKKNLLLEEMCRRDSLTSLYNHSFFQESVEREFRRSVRYDHDTACVLVDIDDFKRVNDEHGHPTGDRVLMQMSELILKTLREVDIVARYGGEEFGLLLPMTNARNAKTVCERARALVASTVFDPDKHRLRLSVSMGIATLRGHQPKNPHQFVEFADEALYSAKRNGKNRTYLHVGSSDNNDLAQRQLEESLLAG